MPERWSAEQAWSWYHAQPWLLGCNYIPSNAINQLEMWQAETFDIEINLRELGWAAGLGMNTVRVYLHDLAWRVDPSGFKQRMERFLEITASLAIRPLFVLLDDCWNPEPGPGVQPAPIPGVHNSGWMMSPGVQIVRDPSLWPPVEDYFGDVLSAFGRDERILMWDLYNEPGNNLLLDESLPLLRAAFDWARAAAPRQPISAGVWFHNEALNHLQLDSSDVITFHNYNGVESLAGQIAELRQLGRPMICTEYMNRPAGSRFETHLPIFWKERVGCYNWGLVSGKTQTIFPWGSPEGAPEPEEWFHDILRSDGSSYRAAETAALRAAREAANRG